LFKSTAESEVEATRKKQLRSPPLYYSPTPTKRTRGERKRGEVKGRRDLRPVWWRRKKLAIMKIDKKVEKDR
jgi:hypothetical protein